MDIQRAVFWYLKNKFLTIFHLKKFNFKSRVLHLNFAAKLSLTVLEKMNIQSRSGVEAVGNLCPHLEAIGFVNFSDFAEPDDLITIEEFQSVLARRCWPEVKMNSSPIKEHNI